MTVDFDTIDPAGPGKGSRRRRVAAGIGAAMLVAAAGGVGFGIGRSLDRDDAVVTPAADEVQAESTPATEPQAAPGVTEPSAAPVATEPADRPATTDAAGAEDAEPGTVTAAIDASGGAGWSTYGGQELTLLFERTTDFGVTVRAHLGELWHEPYDQYAPAGEWQPPAWCFESGQVRLAVSGNGLIDVGGVSWYTEPFKGRSISWVTLGRADRAPHRLVFVQAPADATRVTATFGDGSVDSVAPQNGVAVLVVPGEPPTTVHDEGDYTWIEEVPDFEVTFDGGAEAVTVAGTGVGTWDDPEFQASCTPPPPALPDPGEQPADPEAAEAEITELMSAMYGGAGVGEFFDRLDDPTGVEQALEQVSEGGFQEAAASAQAVVEELVFTDPATAWFRYRIETSSIDLAERYGIAVQIDGIWKITRDTVCQDLSMAGGSCGDDIRVIRPPGGEFGLAEYGVAEGGGVISD
ncbi:MAG: hypothetical protein HKN44_08490 [Ilumatobacter sp.]|nr:hypothetical protein [Ilumatobacter sp.]